MAPTQTVLNGTLTSGKYLKIMANKTEITPNETTKLSACASASGIGSLLPSEPVSAVRKVVRAIDTSRRKPVPRTIEKDRNRDRMKPQIPVPGLDLTPQIVF